MMITDSTAMRICRVRYEVDVHRWKSTITATSMFEKDFARGNHDVNYSYIHRYVQNFIILIIIQRNTEVYKNITVSNYIDGKTKKDKIL